MSGSTRRGLKLPRNRRGPNGERLCRLCEQPVPKGRRQWCSQACVDRYLERSDPQRQRNLVWRRDRGICALCGVDTNRLSNIVPVAEGGGGTGLENLRTLCVWCHKGETAKLARRRARARRRQITIPGIEE